MSSPFAPFLRSSVVKGFAAAVAATILLLGGIAAQERRATVLVDFRAMAADGRPVEDLKAADLVLRVGGRERRITSLDLIRRGESGPPATPAVAPPFATNSVPQSVQGDIVVLIDEASIAPGREQPLREALTNFLSRVSPRDRVRLISLRPGGPALPFEEGLRDLKGALTRFLGHSTATETTDDLICRSRTGLNMLGSLFGTYAGNPVPTFVIVSGGFGSPPIGGVTWYGNFGKCPLLDNKEFENVGAAARAINAAVYVIHLKDVTASQLPRVALERGVETLAGALGATVIHTPASASRIATQTSTYYLAAFEPDAEDRADEPLRVDLRSRRSEVTVRARAEIVKPRGSTSAAPAAPTPDAMIRVPTSYRDLPLRAAGFASRADADGKVRLVVLLNPKTLRRK